MHGQKRQTVRTVAVFRSRLAREERVQLALSQRLHDARTTDNQLRPQSWTERARAGQLVAKDMTR